MARNYRMTPARRAALKKAQQASARKRRGTGKKKPKKLTNGGWLIQNRGRVAKGAVKYGAVAAGVGLAGTAVFGAGTAAMISKQMGSSNRKAARHSVSGARYGPQLSYQFGKHGVKRVLRKR